MDRRQLLRTGLLGALGLPTLAACDGSGTGGSDGGAPAADGFPLEIANCEGRVLLDAAPQRLALLESAPVTTLDGLGVLDRVVARAGSFPEGYYSEDLAARIAAIPALSEDIDASGHLLISSEVVLAQQPDLVLGLPDGLTREGLRDAGAEVLVQDVYCAAEGRASFADLDEQIRVIARVMGRVAAGEELIGSLAARVTATTEAAEDLPARTAAALYPSVGGGPLYAYGAASMVTAQMDALGLTNVFGDTPERVFEVGAEPLLAADPDVVLVLYQDEGDGQDLVREMVEQDQLSGLRAVQEEALLPLLFNFSEPASPLVVDGLERILAWLQEDPP